MYSTGMFKVVCTVDLGHTVSFVIISLSYKVHIGVIHLGGKSSQHKYRVTWT